MPNIDSILIQNGRAWEIWRDTEKAKLPPLHKDLVAAIVERPAGSVNEGDLYDEASQSFSAPG